MYFVTRRLDASQRPWERENDSPQDNALAKEAYTALIRVTPKMPQTSAINSFLESVMKIANTEFNHHYGREEVRADCKDTKDSFTVTTNSTLKCIAGQHLCHCISRSRLPVCFGLEWYHCRGTSQPERNNDNAQNVEQNIHWYCRKRYHRCQRWSTCRLHFVWHEPRDWRLWGCNDFWLAPRRIFWASWKTYILGQ